MRRARMLVPVAVVAVLALVGTGGAPGTAQGVAEEIPSVVDAAADARGVSATNISTAVAAPVDVKLGASQTSVNSTPQAVGYAAVVGSDLGEFVLQLNDISEFPTWCYSFFPPAEDHSEEASCGGPRLAQDGVRASGGGASTRSDGSFDDPRDLVSRASAEVFEAVVPQVDVATIRTSSESLFDTEIGATIARGRTTLEGISLGEGALEIEQLVAAAIVRAGGETSGAEAETDLRIRGASAAGFDVEIGPDGVTVNDDTLITEEEKEEAQQAVNGALEGAGIEVRAVTEPEEETRADGEHAAASVEGLVVRTEPPAGTPIVTTVRLGSIQVSADVRFAGGAGDIVTVDVEDPDLDGSGGATGSGGGPGAGGGEPATVAGEGASRSPTDASGPGTGDGAPSASVTSDGTRTAAASEGLDGEAADHVARLYLGFLALTAVVVALTRTRRLPGTPWAARSHIPS